MSAPASPYQAPGEILSSPISPPTRTVAIIKNHALAHRFEIELRISDAGFEIVKERQMEFDVETDPDTLFDLFGPDYESFAEGPVWVYVLERRRAVEVWHSLMGDVDPATARAHTPNAIRALYGLSPEQNAVMGSPDAQTAEVQIASLFASSPPFPTTELPDVAGLHGDYDEDVDIPAGTLLSSGTLRSSGAGGSEYAPSSQSRSVNGSLKPGFKARPIPITHVAPDIVPRMTKAAALRVGIPVEEKRRAPPTKERLAQTFANVPGHKRAETITVASTAAPTIAPRMTRAASLRLGIKPEDKRKSIASAADVKATFEGVPGHKRRESIQVASTRPPSVAPRLNKSAALRASKEVAPPSSFMFRQPTNGNGAPPSRANSRQSFNGTSSARPTFSRPPSAASVAPRTSVSVSRPPTASTARPGARPSTAPASRSGAAALKINGAAPAPAPKTNGTAETTTPAKPRPRPSSLQAPAITPRPNKSALLRAAKMAGAALSGGGAKANANANGKVGAKPGAAIAPRAVRA